MTDTMMDNNLPPNELAGWAAGISAAVAGAVLGLQRVVRIFSGEQAQIQRAAADADVVGLMRTELKRLAEQNAQLAGQLNELQQDVVTLRRVNGELADTVQRLTAQNEALHDTIGELNGQLTRLKARP